MNNQQTDSLSWEHLLDIPVTNFCSLDLSVNVQQID